MPTVTYDLVAVTDNFEKGINSASGAMKGAQAAAKLFTTGLLVAGTAVLKLITHVTGLVDQVQTLSAVSGLSAKAINGLRLGAKAAGKELETLVPKDLAKRIFETAMGTGEAAIAFEELGVAADIDGELREADDVLGDLIQSLSEVESPTRRAALAEKALGAESKELLNAFKDRADFERFVALGEEFGIKVGPDAAKATAEWQQATAGLSLALETAGQQFLDSFGGPSRIADVVDSFTLGFNFLSTAVASFVKQASENLVIFRKGLALLPTAAFSAQKEFDKIRFGGILVEAFEDASASSKKFFEDVIKGGASAADAAKAAAESATARAVEAAKAAAKALEEATEKAAKAAAVAVEELAIKFEGLQDVTKSLQAIAAAAASDQLSDLDKIRIARDAQLGLISDEEDRLLDLASTGEEVGDQLIAIEMALFEVRERSIREIAALREADNARQIEDLEEFNARIAEADAEFREAEADANADEAKKEKARRKSIEATTIQSFANIAEASQIFAGLTIEDNLAEQESIQQTIETLKTKLATSEDLSASERELIEDRIENRETALKAEQSNILQAFQAQKAASLSAIAINAAQAIIGITANLSAVLGPGAPIAAAAIVVPLATAQSVVVARQKLPQFHDGSAAVDEILATVRQGEAILSQRGAQAIGRDVVEQANRGTARGEGGAGATQIVFRRRVLDTLMSRTIEAGGATSRIITADRPPPGTADPFGGI